jgi:O-antigen/teichoic acid export membrane protein
LAAELKGKVVRGFTWSVAEKIASALFQAWVVVNIVNRIAPEQYALKEILAALVAIFNIFVDSGFSQTLIRDKNATRTDYSSAFWFNVAIATVIYGLLVALSYPAARLLAMPDLVRFAPVFFLIIPAGAVGIIQQTRMTRELDFRKLSTIAFASNVASGLIGVGLAFGGFQFWAIVGQRVSQTVIRSILLWAFGRWKPAARFSRASIGRMFGFSSRLLATDLLNNIYNYIPNFIIPRLYSRTSLAFYGQGRSLRDQVITGVNASMQSVTFPALASIRDDDDKFARAVGRVIGAIAFLMFPIMAGLIVVAGEMFGVFLKADWYPSIPFFRILCLAGFAAPLAVISSNILRARSDGRDVLRAEIVKKVVATVIFAATIPFGVSAIAWGVVAIAFSDAVISFTLARRQTAYGFGALWGDVFPAFALTAIMAGAVWFSGPLLTPLLPPSLSPKAAFGVVLGAKILLGLAIYLGGAALLHLAAFREFMEVVRKIAGKVRPYPPGL